MTEQETIRLELTREQADWLLHKTEKHLKVYEQNVRTMQAFRNVPRETLNAERVDVYHATAIAEQLREKEVER